MKADGVSDNTRGVEYSLKILHDDEVQCYSNRMRPISPLKNRDENCWHPADYNTDIRHHGQNNNQQTNERGEIETEKRECSTDEYAIYEANEQLPAKIRTDVIIDLR